MLLFSELKIRELRLRNRIGVSPMCEYSSQDGFANDWHLVHLGARATGGAGLVFTEAAAVLPEGRISPEDLGIWKDAHVEMLARITSFVRQQGAAPGIQLAHAGRKGSTRRPWESPRGAVPEAEGGWTPIAPSAISFAPDYARPKELSVAEIGGVVTAFGAAARRALDAGFRVIEIHSAHGYLLHEFLSQLSNRREDSYGGSFENRTRLLREVVTAVRGVWPERLPLFVRISSVDWVEGGWQIEDSIALAKQLAPLGVDLIDCSSGANLPTAIPPQGPGMQIPFAAAVRKGAQILTAAVGAITNGAQAEAILQEGKADIVLLARQMLRDPYWPMKVAAEASVAMPWPVQYLRAAPDGSTAQAPLE